MLLLEPGLSELSRCHFELRLDSSIREIIELLVERFQQVGESIKPIEVAELNFEASEERLLRPVTPGRALGFIDIETPSDTSHDKTVSDPYSLPWSE